VSHRQALEDGVCGLSLRADTRRACFGVKPVAEWVVARVVVGALGEGRRQEVGGTAVKGG
jgi:hypothetical protein